MSVPGVVLGQRVGPFAGCLSSALLRQYAAATADPSPVAQAGEEAPAVALVTQIWQAQTAGAAALWHPEVTGSMTGGVHGQHDIVLHRPIEPDEPLTIWVDGHGAKPAGGNSLLTLRYTALDRSGEVAAEQWWSTMLLGVRCDAVGEPAPDHTFPAAARQRPVGTYRASTSAAMVQQYAEVSSDWSAHHFEVEAAQRSGFARPFLHGLCTMAVCTAGVVSMVANGRPSRVRRVAVRFAAPVFVGDDVEVQVFEGGERGRYAFEATSAGATVLSHGRLELR